MKKAILYVVGLLVVMGALSSCSKDEMYWKVETTEIRYKDVSNYNSFKREIAALDDGVTWTVSQVKREVNSIADKYDGKVGCTIYLKTSASMTGPWTTKKTWTLHLD